MAQIAHLANSTMPAKALMLSIREHANNRAVLGHDPDLRYVRRLLNEALDSPHGGAVLLGIADILCASMTGVSLDLNSWIPPRF